MKNRIAYLLYYLKYHKLKSVAKLINLILLVIAIVDACMSIRGMSYFDKLGIKWGSVVDVVVIVINLVWSAIDGFLADAIANMRKNYIKDDSTKKMNEVINNSQKKETLVHDESGEKAIYTKEVNKMLIEDGDKIVIETDYETPRKIEDFIRQNKDELFAFLRWKYLESKKPNKKMFFNEKKLCLTSDLYDYMNSKSKNKKVEVHKGCYYDTFVTNICSTYKLQDSKNITDIYDRGKFYPHDENNYLPPLNNTMMNNEIGVSTIAFTSDNRIVIWRSNANAQLPKGRAVPSGSGSSDWKDRKNKKTLAEAVCYSMQRELAEECSLVSKRNYKKKMQATQTRLIGYWRWLQKGGKPEFSGVTKLGCKQSEIRSNDQEVCMLDGIGEYNQVSSKEDILEYLSNLKNACIIEKENETKTIMSFALYMNILFLEQYIEAEDHGCNKEVQDERVAFLLGTTLPKSKKSSKRKKKSH